MMLLPLRPVYGSDHCTDERPERTRATGRKCGSKSEILLLQAKNVGYNLKEKVLSLGQKIMEESELELLKIKASKAS